MSSKLSGLILIIIAIEFPLFWRRIYDSISPLMRMAVGILVSIFGLFSWVYVPDRLHNTDLMILLIAGTYILLILRYPIKGSIKEKEFMENRRAEVGIIEDVLFSYGYTQTCFSIAMSILMCMEWE